MTQLYIGQTALQFYLGSTHPRESRQKIFIANRITIILSTSTVSQLRYVPTALNPTDDGTRGVPVLNFTSESRWLKGPEFLLKNPKTWSERPHIATEHPNSCFPLHAIDTIVSFQKFSQWIRLLKTVVFSFLLLDKHRIVNDKLGVAHRMKALRWILWETKRTSFLGEINALRSQKHPTSNSRKSWPYPFPDRQGLLRSRRRLSKALFKSSFVFCVVGLHSRPSSIIVFTA